MAKIILNDLENLTNDTSVINSINSNNYLIEASFENTLSRDGTSPNQMQADLDMNSYRILNLPAASSATEPVRYAEWSPTGFPGDITEEGRNLIRSTVTADTSGNVSGIANIELPYTTSASQTGIITKNGSRFIHDFNYGNNGTVILDGYNTFVGLGSGNFTAGNTALATYEASYNTGVGSNTLQSNTTGLSNVACGANSLRSNTTGYSNVSVGREALVSNTTGIENSAIGTFALYSNTTGSSNTASGGSALESNTTGYENVANGNEALFNNTTGIQNTAIGSYALWSNTSGNYNTASGLSSLESNTIGDGNVANGFEALRSNTTGTNNSALGYNALYNNTTGSGNIGIGFVNSAGTYAPVFNPTTENNRLVMGHTGITNAYVQVAWTVVSDERDKTEIEPLDIGLEFVRELQPKSFKFRVSRDSEETVGRKRYGLLAQDVLSLEGNNPVIIDDEDPNKLKYCGESLIPVLVRAIQELSDKIDALERS